LRRLKHSPNLFATVVVGLLAWALMELAVSGWGRDAVSTPVHLAIGVVIVPLVAVLLYRLEFGGRRDDARAAAAAPQPERSIQRLLRETEYLTELGREDGGKAGRVWAEEMITTPEDARLVLYALHRAFPPNPENMFVSYDFSATERSFPRAPVWVEADLDSDDDFVELIVRGREQFDSLLAEIAVDERDESVRAGLAGAYSRAWIKGRNDELARRADELAEFDG
jgi:hypothetical protein